MTLGLITVWLICCAVEEETHEAAQAEASEAKVQVEGLRGEGGGCCIVGASLQTSGDGAVQLLFWSCAAY